MRLQGLTAERPLTHDLFASTLEQLDVHLERVVISELAEETYHARLYLRRDGLEVEVDARPSDALALAVRGEVPIFAAEAVLAQAALGGDPDQEEVEGEEGLADEAGETSQRGGRAARRRVPLERVGEGIVDPRLDMFRDFVNSLGTDPGSGGGGSSGGPGGGRPDDAGGGRRPGGGSGRSGGSGRTGGRRPS
jgi:bifunctional DNase/RNase